MSRIIKAGETRPNGQVCTFDYTDHSVEIAELRYQAACMRERDLEPGYNRARYIEALEAAAALLEVHDDTGIVLDNWWPVRQFIEGLIGKKVLPSEH